MIEVFLRHCYYSQIQEQPNKERPDWWNKEKVFHNFKNTLNPETTHYTIIYDEHYGKIENTFLSQEKDVHIISAGGEAKSFIMTLDYILSQDFDDDTIIYFLEDDYVLQTNNENHLSPLNSKSYNEIDNIVESFIGCFESKNQNQSNILK